MSDGIKTANTHGEQVREEFNAETQTAKNRVMDYDCFHRARQRGDVTFTLVGQDMTSPKLIVLWIAENIETIPAEKSPGRASGRLGGQIANQPQTCRLNI